ncbi:MAG: AraC family transcriptional regulator [Actinobacteria bacterium 13_2_20CM_2_71_6]|nr:MAG: AraC family transcriptional regulator [Actinobacteria bacterium 13_2_20CM_2_71_6]
MHTVAVLALDKVIPFDLSTPVEVFTRTRLPGGRAAYRVRICGATPTVDAGAFTLQPPWGLAALADADTIILPGCADPTAPIPAGVLDALRHAAASGTRIASICSGAFILAATGLLDGHRATTHWLAAGALAARHPEIAVDPDVLYVDNGQFLTSAGAAAGLDLCLHLIRRDHGSAVAADAARLSVMPLEREGGQAHRRFRDQTGTTPLQWLHRARIRQAQYLLEATNNPVDRIATRVGFGSPTAFRDRFKRVVGTSPHAYRAAFRR